MFFKMYEIEDLIDEMFGEYQNKLYNNLLGTYSIVIDEKTLKNLTFNIVNFNMEFYKKDLNDFRKKVLSVLEENKGISVKYKQ